MTSSRSSFRSQLSLVRLHPVHGVSYCTELGSSTAVPPMSWSRIDCTILLEHVEACMSSKTPREATDQHNNARRLGTQSGRTRCNPLMCSISAPSSRICSCDRPRTNTHTGRTGCNPLMQITRDQAQANGQTGRGGEADGQIGSIQIPGAHEAGPSHPANSLRTRAHATIFSNPPCADQTERRDRREHGMRARRLRRVRARPRNRGSNAGQRRKLATKSCHRTD